LLYTALSACLYYVSLFRLKINKKKTITEEEPATFQIMTARLKAEYEIRQAFT